MGKLDSFSPSQINFLKDTFVTKSEFQSKIDSLRDDIFTRLDGLLKELLAIREENSIFHAKLSDHEEKLDNLERARPQNQRI